MILTLTYIDAQGFKRFLKVTWEPFEVQFQSIETRFIDHTNIVVRLANAEHHIHFYRKETQDKQREESENSRQRLRTTYYTNSGTDEKLDERRRKILKWFSVDDFDKIHESHFRKRFQGTGEWLLNDHRFITWRDGAQSRLLWCYGARKFPISIPTSMWLISMDRLQQAQVKRY